MKQKSGGMLGKISQLQKNMEAMQKEISEMTFEGTAANNLVKVEVKGSGELKRVTFDESLKDEDLETLGDLVVAAANHANTQKEALTKKKLAGVTAGVLPFGMKIPGLG